MPLLTAVKVIYIYDLVLSTLALIGFGLIIGLNDDADMPPWFLYIFLVLLPRLAIETIFMAKSYIHVWAKITFIARLLTLVMFFIILTTEIVIRAAIEDEKFVQEDSLLTIVIVGIVLASIDIYFTLMYYQYCKESELRQGISGREQNRKPNSSNMQNAQSASKPANTTKVFVSVSRVSSLDYPNQSIPSLMTQKQETEIKNESNQVSYDEMNPRLQNNYGDEW